MEGRFYDVLNNAIAADVQNRGRPGDDSIAHRDPGVLERYVEPIIAALRACGASPDTADQKPPPRAVERSGGTRRATKTSSTSDGDERVECSGVRGVRVVRDGAPWCSGPEPSVWPEKQGSTPARSRKRKRRGKCRSRGARRSGHLNEATWQCVASDTRERGG